MSEVKAQLDPTRHYEDVDPTKLIQAMGVLPSWVTSAFAHGKKDVPGFVEHVGELYGFGDLMKFEGGELDDKGVYRYPEDPPQHPIAVIKNEEVTVWFYLHAMVAFVDADQKYMTRMD